MDIKTTIPDKDSGKFVQSIANGVNALVDSIRPFTEARGLKADLIRLQREDVLIQIFNKAKKRAAQENISLNPVPTKMLVPFMEQSSLEDMDQVMQDHWASLLLSASNKYNVKQLTFVDILRRLGPQELKILEDICFSNPEFPVTYMPHGHYPNNLKITDKGKNDLRFVGDLKNDTVSKIGKKFVDNYKLQYGAYMHLIIPFSDKEFNDFTVPRGIVYHYTEYGSSTEKYSSLEILQREGLVHIENIEFSSGAGVCYFSVTFLGIEFVSACSPQAQKIIATRAHTRDL